MLRFAWSRSIRVRCTSTELGSFFFQPLQLHLQPADLLVQFGFPHRLLALAVGRAVAEHRRPLSQQLFLPSADLVGMDVVLPGDLIDRLGSFDRFQGHREFELTVELSAFPAHLNVSTSFGMIADST